MENIWIPELVPLDQVDANPWQVRTEDRMTEIEAGIKTFEEAFIGDILLPSGQRVSEWMIPQIDQAYAVGQMPPMLLLPGKDLHES